MLQEIAGFGFEYVELSHGIRITLVPGILQALEEGVIQVSSTHNFCPLPAGVMQAAPNLFEPSAREPREHYQWVRHTKRSIDFAAQVQARVLVCHLGSVIFFWFNPGAKIRRYLEKHPGWVPAQDKKYQALLAKSTAKLRKRMAPYWEQTQASVKEILDYAGQKGVTPRRSRTGKSSRSCPSTPTFPPSWPGCRRARPPATGTTPATPRSRSRMGLLDHRESWSRTRPV